MRLFICLLLLVLAFAGDAQNNAAQPENEFEDVQELLDGVETYFATPHDEPAPAQPEPLVLNARQCVERSLRVNPRVLVALEDVEVTKTRIGQAKSAVRPGVSGRVGFTHTEFNSKGSGLSGLSSFGSFGGFSGGGGGANPLAGFAVPLIIQQVIGDPTEDLQPDDDLRVDQVSVSQVIYAGGTLKAAIDASKFLAESEEWKRQTTLDEVEFETLRAYYDCLLAGELVRVAEESVRTFEKHLSDAEQRLEAEVVTKFEVLRARTELGARQADLITARDTKSLAYTFLRNVLLLPDDTPLALVGKLEWQPFDTPVAELVARALENRPELRALEEGIAAAEANVRGAKGQYYPRVGASADWKNTDGGGASAPDGWTFSLGAEWDLYSGGLRKHSVAEARARLRGLEHQLAEVERLVELDVRQAYIQVQDAMAQIQSEKGTVELGREGLRLAQIGYEEGVRTQTDTLDAELALTSAQTSLRQALRDYMVAHAALDKAVSKSVAGWALASD